MSLFDDLNLVEIDPNPPCLLCGEPIGESHGLAVADAFCCCACYSGPPAWPDEDT